MSQIVYLDTNIYLDYLLDRPNLNGKNRGDVAFTVFNRALLCEFKIVISSWTLAELKKYIKGSSIQMLLSTLKRKLIKVEHTTDDIEKAKQLSEHFHDALHAILAKKAGASSLVTRNLKDFLAYRELVEPKLPENL